MEKEKKYFTRFHEGKLYLCTRQFDMAEAMGKGISVFAPFNGSNTNPYIRVGEIAASELEFVKEGDTFDEGEVYSFSAEGKDMPFWMIKNSL